MISAKTAHAAQHYADQARIARLELGLSDLLKMAYLVNENVLTDEWRIAQRTALAILNEKDKP